jgi:transcriptional regulator with XRE-family HTH domain
MMAVIPRLTGEQIVQMRKSRNMNQTEFGRIFGVGRRSVAAWEANTWRAPADLVDIFTASTAVGRPGISALTRETVKAYKKMRRDGITHASIVELWHNSNFIPTPEAQAAIIEAFPEIKQ